MTETKEPKHQKITVKNADDGTVMGVAFWHNGAWHAEGAIQRFVLKREALEWIQENPRTSSGKA